MLTPIRARHPLLLSAGLTLGLLLALALAGTAVYMLHLSLPTPVPLAFVPIAVALAIWARRSHQWSELGYRRPRPGRYAMIAAGTIVLVLAITAWNIGSWHWDTVPGWLAFTLLVAFVEETFFRGIVLRMLLPYGWTPAWILSSVVGRLRARARDQPHRRLPERLHHAHTGMFCPRLGSVRRRRLRQHRQHLAGPRLPRTVRRHTTGRSKPDDHTR